METQLNQLPNIHILRKNPTSRWVDFKTTHQLDGCTQNYWNTLAASTILILFCKNVQKFSKKSSFCEEKKMMNLLKYSRIFYLKKINSHDKRNGETNMGILGN
jgi:hypothetical protein